MKLTMVRTSRKSRATDSLRAQGVRFEHYDLPGVSWDGDVAGLGEMGHAAWFKDSEGNILCVGDSASA